MLSPALCSLSKLTLDLFMSWVLPGWLGGHPGNDPGRMSCSSKLCAPAVAVVWFPCAWTVYFLRKPSKQKQLPSCTFSLAVENYRFSSWASRFYLPEKHMESFVRMNTVWNLRKRPRVGGVQSCSAWKGATFCPEQWHQLWEGYPTPSSLHCFTVLWVELLSLGRCRLRNPCVISSSH